MRGWVESLKLVVVAILCFATTASAQTPATTPQSKGRPSLYIFSIQGCWPCKRLADEGLADQEVIALISRMEYRKVDMALTENALELYRTHARSGGVPELVLYDGEGKLIGRQSGYETVGSLKEFLRKAFTTAEQAKIKAESQAMRGRYAYDNTN